MRSLSWLFMIAAATIGSLALGVAIAGTDNHVGKPGGVGPMQFAPQRGAVPIIPGTPDEVVSKIASGLTLIANARTRPESVPSDEPSHPPTTGLFVSYDLKVTSTEAADIGRALWEGHLLASAVADEFAARGFQTVIGALGTLVTPDGARRQIGGSVARLGYRDQIFDAPPANVAQTIAARASERGLRDVHVSTVRGLQDAVVIQATTDTPRETAQKLSATRMLDELLDGPATRFEGAFLNVRDASGETVLESGIAARGGASVFWVRPDLGVEMPGLAKP